ncbi:uncharacterized protein LOC144887783 [Branchiostoma floridae x Branchiostoma japonicum]
MGFESLRSTLVEEGLTDISFGAVNSHLYTAPLEIGEIERRVGFPVYQDTAEEEIWKLLDARKDDFIIYDRCGRLVRHVRMPQAHMDNPDVENIIRSVYHHSPCGPCATPPVPMDEADVGSGYLDEEFLSENDTFTTPSPQNGTSVNNVTEHVMFTEHNHTEGNRTHHHHHHHHVHHHHHHHHHEHHGHAEGHDNQTESHEDHENHEGHGSHAEGHEGHDSHAEGHDSHPEGHEGHDSHSEGHDSHADHEVDDHESHAEDHEHTGHGNHRHHPRRPKKTKSLFDRMRKKHSRHDDSFPADD